MKKMTKASVKNWWYYYKWYVICGATLVGIVLYLIFRALGIGAKTPDVQIAYVSTSALSDDTLQALEDRFVSIAGDYNGDGEVLVAIHPYVSSSAADDSDLVYYEYAAEVSLIGDITNCDSYFFLTDDPDSLQKSMQILANKDGSCPADNDFSTDGKVILWADSELLSGESDISSGMESAETADRAALSRLYLGRRFFTAEQTVANLAECEALWERICSE